MADTRGSEAEERPPEGSDAPAASLLRAAPGLMRIAAGAWVRTAEWSLGASAKAASRLTRAAMSGESAAELLDDAGTAFREHLRRVLELAESETPAASVTAERRTPPGGGDRDGRPQDYALREKGAELLSRSADVDYDEETHPAYARILTQLAPDDARILRLLATKGDQAAVDVRTWRPFGIRAETVAPGLSMIGAEAGCRHVERVPAYLNNLFRLGLVWFSREAIDDLAAYQVLEAQPDVLEAMERAGRPSILRRSIRLTPFGRDFCERTLPLDTTDFEAVRDRAGAGADSS